jgi:hypothetical protein
LTLLEGDEVVVIAEHIEKLASLSEVHEDEAAS